MKFFAFEFDQNAIPDSLEGRIDVLRRMGQIGQTKFEEKYSQLVNWFRDYDALYLLSFCFIYFTAYEDGRDEEVEKGYLEFPPHFQEILQAMALCRDRAITAKPLLDQAVKFRKDMKEVGEAMILRMFDIPYGVITPKDASAWHLRMEMMAHTMAIRGWAYDHQVKVVILDLCDLLDTDFKRVFGISPTPLFVLLFKLIDKVNEKLNTHQHKVDNVLQHKNYNEIFDAYEIKFPHINKSDQSTRDSMWEYFGRNLEYVRTALLTHSDLCLDRVFTITADEMTEYCQNEFSKEQIISIFDRWSLNFGELKDDNIEYFILDNPVHRKPFIKIDEESYFTSLWGHLPHLSIRLLEELVGEDPVLKKRYSDTKAEYLEKETEKLFRTHFPSAQIYLGSKWADSINNKQFENDLLVIQDHFAIIVECKSGVVSPAAKRGAPDRLFKTLQILIEEPSEQALRFISFLRQANGTAHMTDAKGKHFSVDTSTIGYFIPLGVTFSQLSIVGSNLKLLVDAGVSNKKMTELITSINLPDLQIIFQLLSSPAQKIHYLQKRREFELNNQFSGDEMDLLAFYLDNGFNLGAREFEENFYYNLTLKSKEIDPYILNREAGMVSTKPGLLITTWWKDILSFLDLRKPENWIESSYILLNFHHEEQKEFEKMFNDLAGRIKERKTTDKHNWVIFSSINPNRRFMLYGYPYSRISIDERNLMMNDILANDTPGKIKGALLIAVNIDKQHYPYSALATILSPELFDSGFSEITSSE